MRQPRARLGRGGFAPSLGARDPRIRRAFQAVVAEDHVKAQALQRLGELPATATTADVIELVNSIVRAQQGRTR